MVIERESEEWRLENGSGKKPRGDQVSIGGGAYLSETAALAWRARGCIYAFSFVTINCHRIQLDSPRKAWHVTATMERSSESSFKESK